MEVLAIETSTRQGSVAYGRGERRAERRLDEASSHARDLLPAIDELLASLGGAIGGLDAIVVGIGPGSYTGLRVGVATAQGLARGTGARLVGVPSFEALAYRELAPGEQGLVLFDARGGHLYCGAYARTEAEVHRILEPCVVAPEAAGALLTEQMLLLGDESARNAAGLADIDAARLRTGRTPSASAVLELGMGLLAERPPEADSPVLPLYLRPFAAKLRRR